MTRDIQRALRMFFYNYDHKLFNAYMFMWECDFFCISKSGYAIEVEVKISRSDFFADFKKKEKHQRLAELHISGPNRFYYAVPSDLIDYTEVPRYAGLLYYNPNYTLLKEIKKAPLLHKIKNNHSPQLIKKYYYKILSLSDELHYLKDNIGDHCDEEGKQIIKRFIDKIKFE